MTVFGKTILGKLIKKAPGGSIITGAVEVLSSPNPLKAASAALLGGTASESKNTAAVSNPSGIAKASAAANSSIDSGGTGGFFKANKTVLGFTFPIWIWFAILAAVLLLLVWLFKRFIKKSPARRRRSGGSSMAARMAKVRAARRKR